MGSQVTVAARKEFSPDQVKLLKRTVAKDCNDEEFSYFLEVAAAYDLNPLVGEVYASKMGGSNGSGGRVVILVGRNGWLKMARRNEDYVGIDGDVVRENDSFKVTRKADGSREILHEYEGDADKRGAIKGAWAEVITTQTRYYVFAPIAEYRPTNENKLKYSPWGSQESVMIQKCAYIAALRIAFSISGVYDEAEMERMRQNSAPPADPTEQIEWGDSADVAERMRALVTEAARLKPEQWRPAKVLAMLAGKSDDEREIIAQTVEEFITANGGTLPEPIVEAEVVG